MTIVRGPRKLDNFTMVQNEVLQDERLTTRALGVLVRLLSRPPNWTTNSEALAREFSCGRDHIRGALKELAGVGYVRLVKSRDEGGLIRSEWRVFESPVQPEPENPSLGSPAPGNPAPGSPVALERTDLQRTDTKNISEGKKQKKQRAKGDESTLQDWLETVKTKGEKAFPDDDPVWRYAKAVKLQDDFIALAWQSFKAAYTEPGAKKYIDWRKAFLNAIKGNWYKLWWLKDGAFELTTKGQQAQREHQAEAQAA